MTPPAGNLLLAALGHAEQCRLRPHLEPVALAFGDVMHDAGDAIDWVYFPVDSLVSLRTVADRHVALEVGMVGREGVVGAACALDSAPSPFRALVQGGGSALRVRAPAFVELARDSDALRAAVLGDSQALLSQVATTAACNRFHVVQQRLARWLLMARDRVDSNHFHLTHEFLGDMLGVRRVGVTRAANALRLDHLIAYRRGDITITDGAGLEHAACSCYARSGKRLP